MIRRLLVLGAAATSILTLSACSFNTNGGQPDPFSCSSISNVHAVVSPDGSAGYDFTANCLPWGTFSVFATYTAPQNGAPGTASERITEYSPEYHKGTLKEAFCSVDPWYTGQSCALTGVTGDATIIADLMQGSAGLYPISASALTKAERGQIKAAKDAWKSIACNPSDVKLSIAKPIDNTSYAYQVPIAVAKNALWCKSSNSYDLDWQYLQGNPQNYTVTWTEKSILASLDESQNQNGIQLAHSSFATGLWRVRARLANSPNAPWTDWVKFTVQ
jgi:hypothetical protein